MIIYNIKLYIQLVYVYVIFSIHVCNSIANVYNLI